MAEATLSASSIQYTINHSKCSGWDSGTLGRTFAGTCNLYWDGSTQALLTASRIKYIWPEYASNCSSMVVYIPFNSQSRPGRCSAYLTSKDLAYNKVVDSTDFIGASADLSSGYIAKCSDPYSDKACTTTLVDGTWYGSGSSNTSVNGIYFKFDISKSMTAGGTYYVYIIQETSGNCTLYGSTSATATLTYTPSYKLTLIKSDGVASFTGGGVKTAGSSAQTTCTASTGYLLTKYAGNKADGSPGGEWTTCEGKDSDTTTWTMNADRTITAYAEKIKYTISYNANGHGTAPSDQTKVHGTALELQPFITKQTSSGYKVTFDKNGGSCSTGSLTSEITYTQTYWNTNSSGTGTNYASKGSYSTDAAQTFYAIWKPTNGSVTLPSASKSNTTSSITVTFNGNGGTTPSSMTATKTTTYTHAGWNNGSSTTVGKAGDSYTPSEAITLWAKYTSSTSTSSITLPTPTRTGYTFEGWSTSKTATSGIKGSHTPTGDTTLYATWAAKKCTVSFDANGGTVGTTSKQVTYGETYGTLPVPTYSGRTFIGWYTDKTGGSQIVSNSVVGITSNQTLYARWSTDSYTITYDANGGTGAPSSQAKSHGADITLSTTTPTRESAVAGYRSVHLYLDSESDDCSTIDATIKRVYSFKSWNTSRDGSGTSYNPGKVYSINESITLYAQWTQIIAVTPVELPTPTRDGYEFLGWSPDGTATSVITGTVAPPEDDYVLYAIWKATSTGLQIKKNGVLLDGVPFVKANSVYYRGTAVFVKVNGNWLIGIGSPAEGDIPSDGVASSLLDTGTLGTMILG